MISLFGLMGAFFVLLLVRRISSIERTRPCSMEFHLAAC